MKFNIAYQLNGKQTSITVDDENKWGKLIDYRIGQEFPGEFINDDLAGYVLRITGGMDKDGFGMKQGIFKAGRVALLLNARKSLLTIFGGYGVLFRAILAVLCLIRVIEVLLGSL